MGWRPTLGQHAASQGHLRNQGVGAGDLFLFWGLFRPVDLSLRWSGRPKHVIWGWMHVGNVVGVDERVRAKPNEWGWLKGHPHLTFPADPSNTLYVAADRLSLGGEDHGLAGAGVFQTASQSRTLSAESADRPSIWSLPSGFLPRGRAPLSFHADAGRWSIRDGSLLLRAASRGQEFVLDADLYEDALDWTRSLLQPA